MEITHNPFLDIQLRIEKLEALLINAISELQNNYCEELNPYERITRKQIRQEYCVSYGTIHNGMNNGSLPYEKLGRKTLFNRVAVEAWVKKGGVKC